MGARENKVEKHLSDEIESRGGLTRKWVSPGHDGVPDQIVVIPMTAAEMIRKLQRLHPQTTVADYHLIEVKTIDGTDEAHQIRERKRLADVGCNTAVTYGKEGVDAYIREVIEG